MYSGEHHEQGVSQWLEHGRNCQNVVECLGTIVQDPYLQLVKGFEVKVESQSAWQMHVVVVDNEKHSSR